MLKGFTKKGELKNINVSEDGELLVKVIPTEKVEVVQTSDQEIVLNSSILILSEEAQEITLGKKVTVISIANYRRKKLSNWL